MRTGSNQKRSRTKLPTYYVVGDFNGDKREDFAMAIVKRKKSEWPFVLAIFNGATARAAKPTFSVDADLDHLEILSRSCFANSRSRV